MTFHQAFEVDLLYKKKRLMNLYEIILRDSANYFDRLISSRVLSFKIQDLLLSIDGAHSSLKVIALLVF